MSNVFTLESLKEETVKKYAPVQIGLSDGSEVSLTSLYRLGKKDRDAVIAIIEDMKSLQDEEEADDEKEAEQNSLLTESLSDLFRLVANRGDDLLSELDGDDPIVKLALMTSVLNIWLKETQLGEA